jgi:hypothetical protein
MRTDTASDRPRGKLDDDGQICDEDYVAHGLVETPGARR